MVGLLLFLLVGVQCQDILTDVYTSDFTEGQVGVLYNVHVHIVQVYTRTIHTVLVFTYLLTPEFQDLLFKL